MKKKKQNKRILISLPQPIIEILNKNAELENRTRNSFIAKILCDFVQKQSGHKEFDK
jgi:metal-responsive CopG/Arc/MetJ family transcriptional regulator